MSLALIGFCIIVGLGLILVEVALIPGTTVVGFLGFAAIAVGVFFSYEGYGAFTGHLTVVFTLILAGVLTFVIVKYKLWNWLALKEASSGRSHQDEITKVFVGAEGITVSAIRPFGKVRIGEKVYEARSNSEYLEPNVKIVVTLVDNNEIVIKQS